MWKFGENQERECWEGKYWNTNGRPIAIVAVITKGVDWAAYIGASKEHDKEKETCIIAAESGAKLSEEEARFFFPKIDLPYRY